MPSVSYCVFSIKCSVNSDQESPSQYNSALKLCHSALAGQELTALTFANERVLYLVSGVGSRSRDDYESASSGRQIVDDCGHAGVTTTAARAVADADGRPGGATEGMHETARGDAPATANFFLNHFGLEVLE